MTTYCHICGHNHKGDDTCSHGSDHVFITIRMSFVTTNTWDILGVIIYLSLIVELWYYKFKNKHFQLVPSIHIK
jgi:hypothetical protein